MALPTSGQFRREEDSRKNEALVHSILDQAGDAIFLLHEGVCVDCNAKAGQMYHRTREEIIGHTPDEFCPTTQPDGRKSSDVAAEILRKALTGEVQFFTWVSCLPDGTSLLTEVSLSRIELTGKVYLQAVVRDITERKRVEENDVRSLTLLRATLDSTADGILTIGLDRKILSYNETFVRMWGIPDDVLATKDDNLAIQCVLSQLQSPEHFLAKVAYLYDHPMEESVDVLDFKDSRVFERLSRPMLVEGRPVGRVWSFRDITERNRALEQIAEQAAYLDEARDAIIVRDTNGKILFWNRGAERVYGWKRREAVGRNVIEILHTNQDNLDEINGATLGQGEWHGEIQHRNREGRKLTVEVRCSLIRDHRGRPKSILSINTDITETKKIEAQFMRAQRMESIGTLASGIAHDLNNILAPIMMSIEVLKQRATDSQSKDILDTIAGNSKRGADIVRQLLTFARGLEGERIEVEPHDLIRNIETIVKDTFPKTIRQEVSLPDESWALLGDLTQLHQVLLNLCLNARDAMPQGGKLTIKLENAFLNPQSPTAWVDAKAGRYVIINVGDTGCGIPSELVDKIFEPFFTTKEIGKGTGLGLSMVLAIVKSHGGFVNVESKAGHGTTFKVYLPAMETSTEARKDTALAPCLPCGNGETVLVIDDEPSVLVVTSQTLEAFGYRTLTASNGEEGVAIYAERRDEILAVLSDMVMPIMDGPATIRALKQINPSIKIMVASGSASGGSIAEDSSINIRYFLAKPYTAADLLKTLRTMLDDTLT